MDNATQNEANTTIKEQMCDVFLEIALWISLVSFIINVFNIVVIITSKLRGKLSYRLVINLAFSDAVLDLVMIVYLGTVKNGMHWSKKSLYLIGWAFDICSLVSLWTMIAMSLDLFIRMKYPLKYCLLVKRTIFRGLIIYIWLISVIPYLTLDIAVAVSKPSSNDSLTDIIVSDAYKSNSINSICALLGVVILLVLYSRIFQDIYLLLKRLQGVSIGMKKSAVTISLVILAYFFCYLPLWVYIFIETVADTDLSADTRGFVLECLAYVLYAMNTLCDPIIYSFRIPLIRNIYPHVWNKTKDLFK